MEMSSSLRIRGMWYNIMIPTLLLNFESLEPRWSKKSDALKSPRITIVCEFLYFQMTVDRISRLSWYVASE